MTRGDGILETMSPVLDEFCAVIEADGDAAFPDCAERFLSLYAGVLESRAVGWPLPIALVELEHALVWQGLDTDERENLERRHTVVAAIRQYVEEQREEQASRN